MASTLNTPKRVERGAISTEPAKRSAKVTLTVILSTTDHKLIGRMYLITSFAYFLIGGLMALTIRAELAFPGMQFLEYNTFNELFTQHGTIMLLLFATPLFAGFANAIMPLQIGAQTWPFHG